MADSAPNIAAKEHRESIFFIARKASTLASQKAESKHFIVLTGAGISTSVGIPDFRSSDDNWALRAQSRTHTKQTNTLRAVPTLWHMALVELQTACIDRVIESLRTMREMWQGVSPSQKFRAVSDYMNGIHDHRTNRKFVCGGKLHDTIINFRDSLPVKPQRLAFKHSQQADLCLVLDHYNEPNLELTHMYKGDGGETYLLDYNPQTREWTVDTWDEGLFTKVLCVIKYNARMCTLFIDFENHGL
ncbi:chromatin regulatory protein sir2, putative [Talaromyces stipitatus ATCC 10500]|uniref:protein acetyllysine N-acetyltransferase n=1 Tax=Talaromyces stipitatus (strain ATCC 10500 / CBS 375.48 / QM 6759 / NRRL 1006) TaxID=441959 RepID=B8LUY8_TALSN|nr:chromatin regulatory protein sir2, putative [Talaromyces stipitatus ATCC 10500]EED22609.1 chromatin regulatory protein sir2, putative [Talaromyces stipitatus ATCC 10500]